VIANCTKSNIDKKIKVNNVYLLYLRLLSVPENVDTPV